MTAIAKMTNPATTPPSGIPDFSDVNLAAVTNGSDGDIDVVLNTICDIVVEKPEMVRQSTVLYVT